MPECRYNKTTHHLNTVKLQGAFSKLLGAYLKTRGEAPVLLCMAIVMTAMPVESVEWHCANIGTGDELRGKVLSDEMCFQYFANISTQEISYCCDRSGFYCQRRIKEVFSPNHVVQGNFRAGQYTTQRDGTGSDRPTISYAGVCSVDKTRLNSGITPTGIPDCGAGSSDPRSPSYCIVKENSVCLDSGQCGLDCGIGSYGGTSAYGGLCFPCPKGSWSDRGRAGTPEACTPCPHGTYGSKPAGCCSWNPTEEDDEGSPYCRTCPSVCTSGREEGKYCRTELDIDTHPPYGELSDADLERIGGLTYATTANQCRKHGGFCNASVTVLDGATHPLQCERYWGPPPNIDPATRAQPCTSEGCGPAFMQFDNHLHIPQHPDAPKDFVV